MIDFNTDPYFDDFSDENKFYQILFRPSVAVQARELNQLQTILQNQIKQQGDHLFKNGSVVIPGEFSVNTKTDYVTLSSAVSGTTPLTDLSVLVGITVQDSISGLQAKVTHALPASGSDPITLYISYTNSSGSTGAKTFGSSVALTPISGTVYTLTTSASSQTGLGTVATVNRGIYYVNGKFVLADSQTIAVDKYNASFNVSSLASRVGFTITESIITPDDAGYESLLDNAQGTYNYAAPGAHRHFIDLVLSTSTIGASIDNFIELARLVGKSTIYLKDKTEYNELDKTLARRTFDQSGNFTVKGFDIDVREHRDNNRGAWLSGNTYFYGDIVTNGANSYVAMTDIPSSLTGPSGTGLFTTGGSNQYIWQYTKTPVYNRGIYTADTTSLAPLSTSLGNANKLAIGFSPGKAYIEGYEIEKIATQYVVVDKPRDSSSDLLASVGTTVGSYIQVTNVYKMPDITTCPLVTLYDGIVTSDGVSAGSPVGTCRIRGVQSDSAVVPFVNGTLSTAAVRLFLFDIKMNSGKDFSRNVKSFYNSALGFTANISLTGSVPLSGSITTNSASTALVGSATRFLSEIQSGDYLYYLDTGTLKVIKVNSITNNQSAILAANATTTTTATGAYRLQALLVESDTKSTVFPLSHDATFSVSNHIYWVTLPISWTGTSSSTITITTTAGTFESDNSNFYVMDSTTNLPVPVTSVVVNSPSNVTLVVGVSSTGFTVWSTIKKTGAAQRKTKTQTTGTDTFALAGGFASNSVLTLSKTDVYNIVSVVSNGVDISSYYTFNDGQMDSYYDYSSLTIKSGFPTPTADVVVTYQYFAHGTGDFFDVNSYTNNGIPYTAIPYYNGLNLRDYVDFRPTISGSVMASCVTPRRGYNMNIDMSYYLPRIDKIAFSNTGNMFDIKGSPSLSPGYPDDPSSGMTMCSLEMQPYIFDTSEVILNKVDNKRYTMRDIGKLENRINTLEYYTSLSLLEQDTASLSITDSATGLSRFKNGFIVDNFSGHNIGDTSSIDYVCSIDQEHNELRPFTSSNNVNLITSASLSSNIKAYGDLITVQLDPTTPHVVLAQNTVASRTEFVNPFAVFTFVGDVKLNPASDDWFETERRPDIVQNVDGNYNTISSMAEKAGVLGTVWNAWQTQWIGVPTQTKVVNKWGIHAANGTQYIKGQKPKTIKGNGHARTQVLNIIATPVGQSRTGVNTSIVAKVDTQTVDDVVLSSAVIPFIRSRNVLVQVKGLKPLTRFYPFFDNIDVSSYCTPATEFTYTPISGLFDSNTNINENAIEIPRRIAGDTQVCLNIGDKIVGSVSGATAIVIGKDVLTAINGTKTYKLYVANVIGTFTSADTITGSISGATGTFISSVTPTNFTSSQTGSLNLLFNIPNTDSVRFRTGSREFKLIDNTSATGSFTSRGRINYNATGVLETKQANVVATRNAELVEEAVTGNQSIIQSTTKKVSDTGWYDPLAQTFMVDSKGGAFLSKVDLFFAAVDNNIPVTIEIRETVNGFPGKTVLPFSRVTISASQVALSSNTVIDKDGVSWPSFDTPTTVSFPSPVYVQDGVEYALVVMSDSNNYKIWISNLGDTVPGTSNVISEQPYLGVLFKSQNATTWTPDQLQDMKFTLYRANFDTSVIASATLVNSRVLRYPLQTDPFQFTAGSKYVRVFQNNHGFKAGDSVTIDSAASPINGITANGTFSVISPRLNSYLILTNGATATSTLNGGGSGIYATRSIRYETLYPNLNTLSFSDTTASYAIVTTNLSTGIADTQVGCDINDNSYFMNAKVVSGNNSLKLIASLNTTNPAVSPVIDTQRMSAVATTNIIDAPTETINSVASTIPVDISTILTLQACTLTKVGNNITLLASTTANQNILKRVLVGSYIRFTGSGANTSYNFDFSVGNTTPLNKFLVTNVDQSNGTLTLQFATPIGTFTQETPNLTVYYSNHFIDEIAAVGSSSYSKYVSKEISLTQPSTVLKVVLATCLPTEADVLVYYKLGSASTSFSATNWVLAPSDSTISKAGIGSNDFVDVNYTLNNLPSFTKVAVKLVMKSTNTAAVPRIKDLRIIACA